MDEESIALKRCCADEDALSEGISEDDVMDQLDVADDADDKRLAAIARRLKKARRKV